MKDPEKSPAASAPANVSGELAVHGVAGADLVLVAGELDLDNAQALYCALRGALDRSVENLTVDLRGVGFCDCSGLNALLRLRHRALTQGKTISIQGACPAVESLLVMTHTRPLFTTTRNCSDSLPTRALRRSA
ncbi:STAS domain-containing protein [Streptomyces violascens]|uniref:STAS domain-containing protein n=1 Tax=Streptomyces violascens TaxID=67381 RepID=UPI003657ABE6